MKKIIITILILCAAALVFYGVKTYLHNSKYDQPGFTCGNGRMEATEVSIATKLAGRLEGVFANEGDMVKKGDKLAIMQLNVLNAELAQAKAQLMQAEAKLAEANFQINIRKNKFAAAQAVVQEKLSSADGAKKRYEREKKLVDIKQISPQEFETSETNYLTKKAEADAAQAELKEAEVAIMEAEAAAQGAKANIEAAKANIARVQADIDDSTLTSTVDGRVQYRVAEPGEVLNSGDPVLNLLDLTDVYMTFFLPNTFAGKVKIGTEARIVLDALPDYPIPAAITFVSSEAQFTPKTVETKEERQKLMFRVKAKVDPELLAPYREHIKTGLPGETWVKLDPNAEWPDFLKLKHEREQQAK